MLGEVVLCALVAVAVVTPRQEARARFERALVLYEEGRFEASLAEFERAYAIAPAHPVLFNIAKVHAQLGRAVEAVDAIRRYLDAGEGSISAARRADAEALLAEQHVRVAHLDVVTDLDVAGTITIDGIDVSSTTSDAPIAVTAGSHVVGVRAPGYQAIQTSARVAGGQTMRVTLTPHRLAAWGSVAVAANVEAVEVLMDGKPVGKTPLSTSISVAPGPHVITGRRAGYAQVSERLTVEAGAVAQVGLRMAIAPGDTTGFGEVRLHLPEAASAIHVDGALAEPDTSTLRLPAGPHALLVRVADREPFQARVVVPASDRLDLFPRLRWTPSAREARLAASESASTAGWVLAGLSVAFAGGGGGMFAWAHGRHGDIEAQRVELEARANAPACKMAAHDTCFGPLSAEIDANIDEQSSANTFRIVGAAAGGVGLVALVAGIVLLATADSEAEFDAAARVVPAPGGLGVRFD